MAERDRLLTSTEAAEYLGASPTSVKRWADEGILLCVKTAGRHRRFTVRDLDSFRQGRMGEVSRPSAVPAAEATPDPFQSWLADLIDGRPYHIQSRLLGRRAELGSWRAVCDEMGPVITALGQAWADGEVSVVQEHLASEALARALARLAETIVLPESAPRALLVALEGEEHTLGLSLVEVALREMGWQSVWAGRKTPLEGLGEALDERNIDLLAVSASIASDDPQYLRWTCDRLAEICRPRSTLLLLGGEGAWPEQPPHGARVKTFRQLSRIVPSPDALAR